VWIVLRAGKYLGSSETPESATHRPLTRPLPRIVQKRAIREKGGIGWNADPGRREGDGSPKLLPSLALGYSLTPLQAVMRKQRPRAAALLEKRPISKKHAYGHL